MKFSTLTSVAFSSTLALLIHAAPNPTTPPVVDVGQPLTFTWTADPTGVWTSTTILLRTGENLNMQTVTTIATGIDCTKTTSFTWPAVPNVAPNAVIYFLEFDQAGATDSPTWTTRFAIAAADGKTVAPASSTQPGGAPTPWGIGTLVGGPTGTSTASNSSSSSFSSTSSLSSSSSSSSDSTTTSVFVTTVTPTGTLNTTSSTTSTPAIAPTITQGSSGHRLTTALSLTFLLPWLAIWF